MMIYNCELGLNYDQFDNVIVILLKLFLELYFYRENYLQIDRLQSFSFLYIKLILIKLVMDQVLFFGILLFCENIFKKYE